jgi:GTP-binding protein
VVRTDANRSFVVADIPGLIEGRRRRRGPRPSDSCAICQRTRLLLHPGATRAARSRCDPVRDARAIVRELKKYDPALHAKPRMLWC